MYLFSIVILLALFVLQLRKRDFLEKNRRWIFCGVTSFMIVMFLVSSVAQYLTWLKDPLSRYLLPPFSSIGYFLFYVGMNFFAPFAISFGFALIIMFAMGQLTKRRGDLFFEKGESAIAGIAVFLSGFPGVIIFFPAFLVFYLMCHLFQMIRGKKRERIPLYFLWLPVSISVIIVNNIWISKLALWGAMKI